MTTPFLAGQVVTADDLNPYTRRIGCQLTRAANQTLPDASVTAISWDTQIEDTDNLWSSGTTITVPFAGIYAVTVTTTAAATATGRSFINLNGNGQVMRSYYGNGGESINSGCGIWAFDASDTITADLFSDMASASTFTARIFVYQLRI